MTWFGERLLKWRSGGSNAVVIEPEPVVNEEEEESGQPKLMMLAADASGVASFKLHGFSDAERALQFIQHSFGDRSDTGLIAFWAMTRKPNVSHDPGADTALEAVVMIRDELRPDVVYPFSFVDIATAHTFVRYEVKRGIDLKHFLVYWAVPVQLVITSEGIVRLFPETPPTPAVHELDSVFNGAAAPPPEKFWVPAPDAIQTIALDRQEVFVSTEDDPIEALFTATETPGMNNDGWSGTTEVAPDTADDPEPSGDVTDDSDNTATTADEAAEEAADGDSAGAGEEEETVRDEIKTDSDTGVDLQAVTPDGGGTDSAAVVGTGERLVVQEPVGMEFPAGRARASSEAFQTYAGLNVQRVLDVRRWEVQPGPFKGFQSPPGRF